MTHICDFMNCSSTCSDIQTFKTLFCTPTFFNNKTNKYKYLLMPPINFDKIIEFMESYSFNNIYKDIFSHSHECISYNIYDLDFNVIQFLIQNEFISIDKKPNTFYIIDIITSLFCEISHSDNIKTRIKEYIDFFWEYIIEANLSIIINYTNETTGYTMANYILNCLDINVRLEYINKYIDIWNTFYPDTELKSTYQMNENVDGYNVYMQLALDNNIDVLKKLFLRDSYNSKNYEWRVFDTNNKDIISVPIISFLLKENYYIRDIEKLQELADTILVLIEYGKIPYDLIVPETENTLMDYINKFGYNYPNSPIMKVFKKYPIKNNVTNIPIPDIYDDTRIDSSNIPYWNVFKKYEYAKNPDFAQQIMKDILEEYQITNIDYSNFVEYTGFYHILKDIDEYIILEDAYVDNMELKRYMNMNMVSF